MGNSNFNQPNLNQVSRFQKIKSWISSLDIVSGAGRLIARFVKFLRDETTISFWLLFSLVVLSLIGIYTHDVKIISLAGLIWMSIWLIFFGVAVYIHWLVENVASMFEPEEGKVSSADKFIESALNFTRRFTFSVAGLMISIGHLFISAHLKAASDFHESFLSFDKSSWLSWLYVVGAPIIGKVIDELNKKELITRGGVMFLLGIIQFYSSFVILFTGLLGGGMAITVVHTVVKKPWELITHDIFQVPYIDSFSHLVYQSIGGGWFIFLYLIIPTMLAYSAYIAVHREKKGTKMPIPPMGLYSLLGISLIFLIIGLIVSWNEGWIIKTFIFISEILVKLYHFIMSWFS